jgi:hypothetical protein
MVFSTALPYINVFKKEDGETGRAKIDAKFSARTMVERIRGVYEELLEIHSTVKTRRMGRFH